MLLTGEANVKREEEFERERDEEIYVYSMKIPQFHPFHFISLFLKAMLEVIR